MLMRELAFNGINVCPLLVGTEATPCLLSTTGSTVEGVSGDFEISWLWPGLTHSSGEIRRCPLNSSFRLRDRARRYFDTSHRT